MKRLKANKHIKGKKRKEIEFMAITTLANAEDSSPHLLQWIE